MHKFRLMLITMLLTLTLVAGGGSALAAVDTTDVPSTAQDGLEYAAVYETVAPSVVAINVAVRSQTASAFGNGFSLGSGSGFVFDTQGHIVTNFHVIDGAVEIQVEFFDGTLTRAEIIGSDPESDLAVIKVDVAPAQLQPVTFADSSELFVGQPVAALGSPFGQEWTLTTGIVSALNRTVSSLGEFRIGGVVQTDAAINPGNSGGPLLDLNGHVIGVNTQILSSANSNSGVGFAIPSNLTQRVAIDIIDDGDVDYAYIGISGNEVNLTFLEALDLPNNTRGVVVNEVQPGTGAERAGLRSAAAFISFESQRIPTRFDLITAIDGRAIRDFDTLISYLSAETLPGDTIVLTILRNGTELLDIEVTLGERPESVE